MIKWTILTLFSFTFIASADVIDLGSIEIEGEVRRPLINYSSTDFSLQKELNFQLNKQQELFLYGLKNTAQANKNETVQLKINQLKINTDYQTIYRHTERGF
jgi:hypothetical protein